MAEGGIKTGYTHIVRTPAVMGGEPRIAKRRIRVRAIVAARDIRGLAPEEIAATIYPELTLAEVYSALAYYEDHHDKIEQASRRKSRFLKRFLKTNPQLVRGIRPTKS